MADLLQRYADQILGVISCYDRVIIRGAIPGFSYAKGMESYLRAQQIRLFDFPRFAMPLRDAIRSNAHNSVGGCRAQDWRLFGAGLVRIES
jgi:hypothetical protein